MDFYKETVQNKKNVTIENQGSLFLKRERPGGDSDEDSGKEKKAQSLKSIKLADDSDNKKIQKVEKTTEQSLYSSGAGHLNSGHVKVKLVKKEDKFYFDSKKSDVFSVTPPKLTALPSTKDKNRDKIRELLVEGLSKVAGEVSDDNGHGLKEVGDVNIKDPKNRDFRRKVLLGQFPPMCIADLSPEEMASDERKRQNEEIKEKALFNSERGPPGKASNGAFQCGRCKKRETTYYRLQTRSADEPMTTFVTCTNCNKRWKC
ncbi:OLC1v1036696C1 [Oldenlandia corymbosa var. corymbosa]|uniref:OLC1v1036696C1 n=1 Tax=Oldenlandia corymbosa var. corymbosa TaxID=529605 RepID=A0AAV1CWJ7_OLDCO|nr:OLC1v1036696C1 [Oldenlandia corymbosa var. corymbosa]